MYAAAWGRVDIVERLLEAGANTELQDEVHCMSLNTCTCMYVDVCIHIYNVYTSIDLYLVYTCILPCHNS